MHREECNPRLDWEKKVEAFGLFFFKDEGLYWDESAFYALSRAEYEQIAKASEELHAMHLAAAEQIIQKRDFGRLGIAPESGAIITDSWRRGESTLSGRFDFSFKGDGTPPKLLEYNADASSGTLEAGLIQMDWQKEIFPQHEATSLHTQLVARLKEITNGQQYIHLASNTNVEDRAEVDYLTRVAQEAGIATRRTYMDELRWDNTTGCFVDSDGNVPTLLYTLYPWTDMLSKTPVTRIQASREKTIWIEPAWKMLLSNKGFLAYLWDMFPGHPNLLETYTDGPHEMPSYVRKPFFAEGGVNLAIIKDRVTMMETTGNHGNEPHIYQELALLPTFGTKHALLRSWIVGDRFGGIGIWESTTPITGEISYFVPHIVENN